MQASTIFGGTPVGSIASGQFAADPAWLPCDGTDYLAASYPLLDTSGLLTYGSNAWTARTLPVSQAWSAAVTGGGVTVAVSSTTGTTAARSTDNGATWASVTIPSGSYSAVDWNGSLFVAVGTNVCATSPDGSTWTARTIAAGNWCAIKWGGGLWVVLTSSATTSYTTSTDAITWTTRTLPYGYQWSALSYINAQFWAIPYYAGANDSVGVYFVSDDGITNWIAKSLPISSIAWSPAAQFNGRIYIGQKVAGQTFVSSDGGFSWTAVTGIPQVYSLFLANGYLMAPRYTGAGNSVCVSVDGLLYGVKQLPATMGAGAMCATAAGVLILPASASAACATLALDTTRFRTPRAQRVSDTDRLYIRAK